MAKSCHKSSWMLQLMVHTHLVNIHYKLHSTVHTNAKSCSKTADNVKYHCDTADYSKFAFLSTGAMIIITQHIITYSWTDKLIHVVRRFPLNSHHVLSKHRLILIWDFSNSAMNLIKP